MTNKTFLARHHAARIERKRTNTESTPIAVYLAWMVMIMWVITLVVR